MKIKDTSVVIYEDKKNHIYESMIQLIHFVINNNKKNDNLQTNHPLLSSTFSSLLNIYDKLPTPLKRFY